jgi:hypothetical protein
VHLREIGAVVRILVGAAPAGEFVLMALIGSGRIGATIAGSMVYSLVALLAVILMRG